MLFPPIRATAMASGGCAAIRARRRLVAAQIRSTAHWRERASSHRAFSPAMPAGPSTGPLRPVFSARPFESVQKRNTPGVRTKGCAVVYSLRRMNQPETAARAHRSFAWARLTAAALPPASLSKSRGFALDNETSFHSPPAPTTNGLARLIVAQALQLARDFIWQPLVTDQ